MPPDDLNELLAVRLPRYLELEFYIEIIKTFVVTLYDRNRVENVATTAKEIRLFTLKVVSHLHTSLSTNENLAYTMASSIADKTKAILDAGPTAQAFVEEIVAMRKKYIAKATELELALEKDIL